MIDYEKLKEHLNKKRKEKHKTCLHNEFDNGYFWAIKDIESLLENSPEPKYKLDQKVWVNDYEFGPVETTIEVIAADPDEMYYESTYQKWRKESELYPSCEALIDAQIEYWTSLKSEETSTCSDDMSMSSASGCDEIKCEHYYTLTSGFACIKCGHNPVKDGGADCEHESDGYLYGNSRDKNKCKHCGEFYR